MQLMIRGVVACSMALLLAGCAGGVDQGARPGSHAGRPVSDYPVKIGQPYQVGGLTYIPADAPNYDEVGYASWYGEDHDGKPTANGESFRPGAISAAHKTLPLPSYVEVTALDTGRTILVRVNDRGPFVQGRIIDLSSAAAAQLGIRRNGIAPVRVRRVHPPEQERALLRSGGQAPSRLNAPAPLLAALRQRLVPSAPATPSAAPVRQASVASAPVTRPPMTGKGGYVVQVGAFSSKSSADGLAAQLGAWVTERNGLWRVRFGPYASQDEARQGVEKAAAKGYSGARIMDNDSR